MATGNFDDRMSAAKGTYLVNNAVAVNKKFDSFFVTADAVITNLEVNGVVADVRGNYIADTTLPIPAGTFLTSLNNDQFTSVTITSGSIILILD